MNLNAFLHSRLGMQKTMWALTQYFRKDNYRTMEDFIEIRESLLGDRTFPLWFREADFLDHLREAEAVFAEIKGSAMRWVSLGDEDFPVQLQWMRDPCYGFFALGHSVWMKKPGLAVVGSREVSSLSESWLESNLEPFIQKNDFYIASGGARGVDQVAHRICVRSQKPTLVFLPSGISQIYPTSLHSWMDLVLGCGGAFISEYKPSEVMRKNHFAERNRLISGISLATLIVEASRRSGTMLTARASIEQHRPLLVLPGHPYDFRSQGSVDLICEGATPVRDCEDLSLILNSERRSTRSGSWHEGSTDCGFALKS